MKVLHIDTESTWRGGEAQLLHLLRGLRGKGYIPLLIVPPGTPLENKSREEGFKVYPLSMRGEGDLGAVCRIYRIIQREKPHLVHLHTSHAHTLGGVAARISRVQVIVSRRVDFPLCSNPFTLFKYRCLADRIIAVSEAIKKVLVNSGVPSSKIAVVYSGIDLHRLQGVGDTSYLYKEIGIEEGERVVGTIAHLADHKGHRYLLQAIPRILNSFPRTKFLIVGEGPLEENLKNMASYLGLGERVFFAGFREDIPQILSLLDLFVLPSHLEGLCTSLLDAMAMGKPIVATRVGGIPEAVVEGRTGLLVPPRDPESLAEAIIRILGDEIMAQKMGQEGKKRARKFSFQKMVENTIRIYEEVGGEERWRN